MDLDELIRRLQETRETYGNRNIVVQGNICGRGEIVDIVFLAGEQLAIEFDQGGS